MTSSPLNTDISNQSERQSRAQVANWLFFMAGLVFAMIVVGAITRLTESGLSMVEWRAIIDTFPPMNEAEWQREFELYQATPEYIHKNFWMNLDDFKKIYFWEWFHRFMGRIIGVAYALPYIYFLARKKIPSGYGWPLFGLLILGGFQGFMGWYMVASGLVDRPSVSHYRLAAHLSIAFVILCLLVICALSLKQVKRAPMPQLYAHGWVALGFLAVTIFWGAYVAGLNAGLIYNEFPLMGSGLMPPDMWHLEPHWINVFENPAAVQFTHRWLAIVTALVLLSLWAHSLKRGHNAPEFHILAFITLLQVGLGIATLLSGVNIVLATLHQAGAALLLLTLSICLYKAAPLRRQGS
ncbi:MAG: COX15/CtaA family protein [Alphaproteobacteria bacterium]